MQRRARRPTSADCDPSGDAVVQIFRPSQPLTLLNIKPAGVAPPTAGVTYTVPFVLPTPDARVTLSLAIVITQVIPTTMPFDVTLGGALQHHLWIANANSDTGGSGLMVPTGNLFGTRATPTAIPTDVNICGYADDFLGGMDALVGEYSFQDPAGGSLTNGLRVALYPSYEPTASEVCDEEWRDIVQSLTIRAPQALVFS